MCQIRVGQYAPSICQMQNHSMGKSKNEGMYKHCAVQSVI